MTELLFLVNFKSGILFIFQSAFAFHAWLSVLVLVLSIVSEFVWTHSTHGHYDCFVILIHLPM